MTKPHHTPNAIGHFDIAGPDLPALSQFYGTLFGWRIDAKGPGYALAETPDGTPGGALVEAEQAALTVGIVVPDLEKVLGDVGAKGGKITMPATDNGWVKKAQIADPAGNVLTLIQG